MIMDNSALASLVNVDSMLQDVAAESMVNSSVLLMSIVRAVIVSMLIFKQIESLRFLKNCSLVT